MHRVPGHRSHCLLALLPEGSRWWTQSKDFCPDTGTGMTRLAGKKAAWFVPASVTHADAWSSLPPASSPPCPPVPRPPQILERCMPALLLAFSLISRATHQHSTDSCCALCSYSPLLGPGPAVWVVGVPGPWGSCAGAAYNGQFLGCS